MAQTDDGGPFFPIMMADTCWHGMSYRDFLIALIAAGLSAYPGSLTIEETVTGAEQLADAIVARKRAREGRDA